MFARLAPLLASPPALLQICRSRIELILPGRDQAAQIIRFSIDDDPDCSSFAQWLNSRPQRQRWRLLVDLDDESHFVEELPALRGKDGRALIARRLQHWFDDPALARASLLEAGAGRRQRMLFAGLNRPQRLQAIFQALAQHQARIEAVVAASALIAHHCSAKRAAGLASLRQQLRWRSSVAKRAGDEPAAGAVLILSFGSQTIRFILADRGQPRLVRTLAAELSAEQVCSELARTFDYARELLLTDRRTLQPEICLLVPQARLFDWQQALAGAGLAHQPARLDPTVVRAAFAHFPVSQETETAADSIDPLLHYWLEHDAPRLLHALSWPCPATAPGTAFVRRKPLYAMASTLAASLGLPLALPPDASSLAGRQFLNPPLLHKLSPVASGEAITLAPPADGDPADAAHLPPPLSSGLPAIAVADRAVRINGLLRSTKGQTVVWLDGKAHHQLPAGLRLAPYPALELTSTAAALSAHTAQAPIRAGDHWLTDAANAALIAEEKAEEDAAGAAP